MLKARKKMAEVKGCFFVEKKKKERKKLKKIMNKGGKGLSIKELMPHCPTSSLVPWVENNITMIVNFIILLSGKG